MYIPLSDTPTPLQQLAPWRGLQRTIAETDLNIVRSRSDQLVSELMEVWAPLAHGIRQRFDVANTDGRLHEEYLWVCLWLGRVKIYVGDPLYGKAFAFESIAWSGLLDESLDPLKWIETGEFIIDRGLLLKGSLADRLANLPLYTSEPDLKRLVEKRTSSGADQRETATRIIVEHQGRHGDQPMLRDDFVAAVCEALPGLSKRGARALWGAHAPKFWKRGGRRRRRESG